MECDHRRNLSSWSPRPLSCRDPTYDHEDKFRLWSHSMYCLQAFHRRDEGFIPRPQTQRRSNINSSLMAVLCIRVCYSAERQPADQRASKSCRLPILKRGISIAEERVNGSKTLMIRRRFEKTKDSSLDPRHRDGVTSIHP
jgi:hypothetical protein